MILRDQMKSAYLDYVNNYLSIQAWADAHHMSKECASDVIDMARAFHNADCGDVMESKYTNPHL